jgi:Fe-S-cluster containining protein
MTPPRNGGGNGKADAAPLELPLLNLPSAHPCHACGECCRYVAIEIDAPTTNNDYDQMHWYLVHGGVSVYVDWEGDWFVEFTTRCDHLTEGATCGVYEERPKICSDFSFEECEVTTKEPAARHRFDTLEQFLAWFRERRPKSYARYAAFRRDLLRGRAAAAGRARRKLRVTSQPARTGN